MLVPCVCAAYCGLVPQVLQSLAFLHSLGLVHSDLKPENILIKSYSRCEPKALLHAPACGRVGKRPLEP